MLDWRPFADKFFHQRLIVMDTETTGLPRHPWARVVDLAAVVLDEDGNHVDRFESLAMPDILDGRAAEALAVNHITPEMLKDAPPQTAVAASFASWVHGHGDPLMTTYNVDFDKAMLGRMGASGCGYGWAPCVMKTSMAIMGPAGALVAANPSHPAFNPRVPWLFTKLVKVADYFGSPIHEPVHRALGDAKTAADIWHAMRVRILADLEKEEQS